MLTTPIAGDEREPAILDLVPLAVTTIRWASCLASSMAFASLTSNDQLMPGSIAGESRDGQVGAHAGYFGSA
jgi:hypothetical protein